MWPDDFISGSIFGIPIIENPHLDSQTMYLINNPSKAFIVGTRPLTPIEQARYHARWIVQNGLRDVLEWLGEKPLPEHPIAIVDTIKAKTTRVVS